jgi:myo-inositol-1(or 4)-monophosphatase
VNLPEILEQVITVVKETGEFIREEQRRFDSARIEKKAKNDLVSYVDRESEIKLVNGLKKILPEAGFIAEENTETKRAVFNWIIDPLDGTTNFIHSIPAYCISVALAKDDDVLIGVVLEISRDECFYTCKNQPAFLNGTKISVSTAEKLEDCLIATGFPVNHFDEMEGYKKSLDFFVRHTHGVRRIGSAALDLCYVACGRFAGFFEVNLKPWDVAAGALLVKNAGGAVSDFKGSDDWLFGKRIIASGHAIQADFFTAVTNSFA